MKNITLIILAAGNSRRFGRLVAKQWLRIGRLPLWLFVARRMKSFYPFVKVIVVAKDDEVRYMQNYINDKEIEVVAGGDERQNSLQNAIKKVESEYVLVSDVARACISKEMIEKLSKIDSDFDCLVPYLDVNDTVYYNNEIIDRAKLKRVQTPQLSLTKTLREAIKNANKIYTDESSLILDFGGKIEFIKGEDEAEKITYGSDLKKIGCLLPAADDVLVGSGFDVHPFEQGKKMFLCGVEIDEEYGFRAHSDGDVAIHALIDALLGAMGAGDIGELFPDNDNRFKDIDSKLLLKEVVLKIIRFGFEIINADITIIAQKPKLSKYKNQMRKELSNILEIEPVYINIKATTTENLGFIGRKEGVGVMASVGMRYYQWARD